MPSGLEFSPEERTRLNEARNIAGCTYVEFIHHATMHAVDELLGTAHEMRKTSPGLLLELKARREAMDAIFWLNGHPEIESICKAIYKEWGGAA